MLLVTSEDVVERAGTDENRAKRGTGNKPNTPYPRPNGPSARSRSGNIVSSWPAHPYPEFGQGPEAALAIVDTSSLNPWPGVSLAIGQRQAEIGGGGENMLSAGTPAASQPQPLAPRPPRGSV